MSAWKPGDVARTIAGGTVARTALGSWVLLDDGNRISLDEDRIARQLVVIDPDDTETVERLTLAFWSGKNADTSGMQAALRSLLAPPTPDEPTGLGAVVEDADGTRWVHRGHGFMTAWSRVATTTEQAHGEARGWSDIAAVRVLSEGVAE